MPLCFQYLAWFLLIYSSMKTKKAYLKNQRSFHPPYCPNGECVYHQQNEERFYVKNGFARTEKYPGVNQRYRCKECGHNFSYATFSLDYRFHKIDLHEEILFNTTNSMSNRSIARKLKIAEVGVRRRIKRLKRQALLKMTLMMEKMVLPEPIVYDGFETFSASQFSPNNINLAVGKESLFIYDVNFAPLNRKGVMTPFQKVKQQKLIQRYGIYPPNATYRCTQRIIDFLLTLPRKEGPLVIHTDQHNVYERIINEKKKNHEIEFHQTSSRDSRTSKNQLFAVNNTDNQLRHFLCACKRETIAFSKHEGGLMDKIILFTLTRNFMRSKFIRPRASEPDAHQKPPAFYVGLVDQIQSFKQIFDFNRTIMQVPLRKDWQSFYFDLLPFSRSTINPYCGI